MNPGSFAIAVLTGALLVAAQTPDHNAAGLKALDERNYELAVQHFSKAVAADPKDYYSHFNLALAHSAAHQDEAAITHYRKALELKPGLYEAQLNLGLVLLQNRKAAEALPLLESAARQKPMEFRPVYYLAEANAAENKLDLAEAGYRTAILADAKSAGAHYGLGRVLAQQGKLSDAEASMREAGKLDEQYKDAVLELAALYEKQNKQEDAVRIYREFAHVPAVEEALGMSLLKLGRADESIAPLEAAGKKNPTAANRYALAQAYLQTKQHDKALPLIEQVIANSPNEPSLYMLRGRLLRDQRKLRDAANSFYAAAKLKPDNVEAWSELAAMLNSLEEYPTTLAALDRIRQLNAEQPGHLFLRAITLDRLKQQKPALEAYKQFLTVAAGKFPDQEFQSRQRARILEKELSRK